jgi:hypothetical protein
VDADAGSNLEADPQESSLLIHGAITFTCDILGRGGGDDQKCADIPGLIWILNRNRIFASLESIAKQKSKCLDDCRSRHFVASSTR